MDVQADLSLSWSNKTYCRFCHVLAHNYVVESQNLLGKKLLRQAHIFFKVKGPGTFTSIVFLDLRR